MRSFLFYSFHALRRIRLMLNFNLQRQPFMKCQQPLDLRFIFTQFITFDYSFLW
jgi:hypothetical protein